MRSLLAESFSVDEVFERPFICWKTLNWKGRIAAAVKLALFHLGSRGSNENVFFKASKSKARDARPEHCRSTDPVVA